MSDRQERIDANARRMQKCARLAALDAQKAISKAVHDEYEGADDKREIATQVVAASTLFASIVTATLRHGDRKIAALTMDLFMEIAAPELEKLAALAKGS